MVFRVDADGSIGEGHAFRCLALANAFAAFGWRCAFATATSLPNDLSELGFEIAPRLSQNEPGDLARIWPGGSDLFVIDHYGKTETYETSCRPWAKNVMAVEDVANRKHDCEFLLDSNASRSASDYAALVPNPCMLLLGSTFVPLRREFAKIRHRMTKRLPSERDGPYQLLITLGGTAQVEFIKTVLDAIAEINEPLMVDVIWSGATALRKYIGSAHDQHKVGLRNAVSEMSPPSIRRTS